MESPEAGWGTLTPDERLTPETVALVKALDELPTGQRHALLTRAVPRYLSLNTEVDVLGGNHPSASDMADATSSLSQLWMDIVGIP